MPHFNKASMRLAGPRRTDESLSDSTTTSSTTDSSLPSSLASMRVPSFSSQSDINDVDPSHSTPPSLSDASSMGLHHSKPSNNANAAAQPSATQTIGSAAANTGLKIKRVLNVRKKKQSEDLSPPTSSKSNQFEPPRSASSDKSASSSSRGAPSSSNKRGLNIQLPTQVFSSGRKSRTSNSDATFSEPQSAVADAPPPVPQKLYTPPPAKNNSASPSELYIPPLRTSSTHQRSSVIPISPGIASAVQYISEEGTERRDEADSGDKESWRKSDSTMSHRTIRPSATVGSRTPRPGSIVATVEEDDLSQGFSEVDMASQTTPNKNRNRRSMSLNLQSDSQAASPPPEFKHPSPTPTFHTESSTLSHAAAQGIIAPFYDSSSSAGQNLRGRLAAWAGKGHHPSVETSGPIHRKASPSLSSQAAAAGLAKRAVEKMGRAWGGINNGHSSSASLAPSSFPGGQDLNLLRTDSGSSSDRKAHRRRTPNSPSGAWSIASGATANSSDSDPPPVGPTLGRRIRGPLNPNGGVVFGRRLSIVARDTAISRHASDSSEPRAGPAGSYVESIESRCLPAVVIRCAQHLSIWGVQEEGLFRVNGRPSHVSKIRTEFDTGADYDMSECSPGELDPHAVAGIFKAYLREMPEPILTHALMPSFDAAMAQESQQPEGPSASRAKIGGRGPTLPSGPRAGTAIRKPPSLSTLAMPDLNSMRQPSSQLVKDLRTLIDRLPKENAELLKTVIELIKKTAQESKVTKMPLSNLLLVFCPSLHMGPSLLRVLSECEDIWQAPVTSPISEAPSSPSPQTAVPRDHGVIDIKRPDSLVLDISATSTDQGDAILNNSHAIEGTSPPGNLAGSESPSSAESPQSPVSPASPSSPSLIDIHSPKTGVRRRPTGPRGAHSPGYSRSNTSASLETAVRGVPPNVLASALRDLPHDMSQCSMGPDVTRMESETTSLASSVDVSRSETDGDQDNAFTLHQTPSAPVLSQSPNERALHGQRRPTISGPIGPPIHFPTMTTPTSPAQKLSPRRSFPTLSLAAFTGSSSSPPSPNQGIQRAKRPSIHLLFSKRSASPLSSSPRRPVISGPISPSTAPVHIQTRSISNPIIGVEASPNSEPLSEAAPVLPPVLDDPTGSGSLGLGIDFSKASPETSAGMLSFPSDSDASSHESRRTPIADLYQSAASSSTSLASPSSAVEAKTSELPSVPHLRLKPGRQRHSGSSKDEEGVEEDDDWTKTVLLAADVDWRNIPTRS